MKKIIRNFYSKIFLHVSLVMSSKRQTVLSGQAFKAQVQLTDDVVKEWCVASLDDAASELLDDWQGKIIAMVGLTLTADNRNVENARLLLQGSMYDNAPKKIPANKFWKNFPSGTYILLKNIDSSLFRGGYGLQFRQSRPARLRVQSQEWRLAGTRRPGDKRDARLHLEGLCLAYRLLLGVNQPGVFPFPGEGPTPTHSAQTIDARVFCSLGKKSPLALRPRRVGARLSTRLSCRGRQWTCSQGSHPQWT